MANHADDIVNIGPNGFASVKIKAAGDAGYYSFPHFRDGSFRITPVGSLDHRRRQQNHHFRMTFGCTLMATDITNMIELLPVLSAGASGKLIDLKVEGIDSQVKFYSGDITSVGGSHVGVLWTIRANHAEERFIRFEFSRLLTPTDFADACVGPATADGSQDPGDALYLMRAANLGRADIRPVLFRRLQWAAMGGTISDNSLTNISDGTFEMVGLGKEDSQGRAHVTRIETRLSVFGMQLHQDELTDLATHNTRENDFKIDFTDDYATFTSGKLAGSFEVVSEGNIDDNRGIRIEAAGTVLPSEIAGIWVDSSPS